MRTCNSFWCVLICLLSITLALSFSCASAIAEALQDSAATKAEPASIVLSVTDVGGAAIEGAKATLFEWTGKFERCPQSQPTAKDGRFYFDNIDAEQKYYLYVVADGYASSMQGLFSLTAGVSRQIQFKMSRAATSWIDVVDVHGKPVVGAEVAVLQYTDANKNDVYLSPERDEILGIDFSPSDAEGRLRLPPLPQGCKCSVTVVHPDWKANILRDFPATDGLLASLTLSPGVKVVCELKQSADDKTRLDGEKVTVKLGSSSGSRDLPADLRHAFPIKNNRIEFTVHPIEYESLGFSLKSHWLVPSFLNHAIARDDRLDLRTINVQNFSLTLKQKILARGHVADTHGKGVPGVSVSTYVAVDDSSPWPSETEEKDRFAGRQWADAGYVETDLNGDYAVELAAGKVCLELVREGYFSDPVTQEFVMPADKEFLIPNQTVYDVPKLLGKVVDSGGKPVPQAYVRMRHSGYGDADPVTETGEDGRFELTLSRIPYSGEQLGLETLVQVVAFSAKDGRGGAAKVNLKDEKDCKEIEVTLEPRPADWLMNIAKPFEFYSAEERKKLLDAERLQFPNGGAGKEVPLMREGTWLNTQATSLEDFRGKYVLLDFWFIGCAPCFRDMPSVRMAHRQFADLGFSVVSVHRDGELPKDVQTFADKNKLNYPIVVDDADGTITNQFRSIGLSGFPSYILLDPHGRILHNDATSEGPSLRDYKLELIHQAIRNARN